MWIMHLKDINLKFLQEEEYLIQMMMLLIYKHQMN